MSSVAGRSEDLQLVERAREGDLQAFDALITKYRTRVFHMVYSMVRNEEDALDLAQEGFVRAWKNLHRFRGEASFYTWLYRIVNNVALDFMRRQKRRPSVSFEEQTEMGAEVDLGLASNDSELPHKNLEHAEMRSRIDEAIATLSPKHQAVILLKEVEGLHYHEIAQVMKTSIGTVMSRLFYARKRLQMLLGDLYEQS